MPKMNRLICLALLCLCLPLLMAMGMGDGEGPTRIPEPDKSYKVIITDISGQRVELTEFSLDGQVFVFGSLGDGQAAIPFERVTRVDIVNGDKGLIATVGLNDGKSIKLKVRPGLKAYGKADFGLYRIKMSEVSTIEIEAILPE